MLPVFSDEQVQSEIKLAAKSWAFETGGSKDLPLDVLERLAEQAINYWVFSLHSWDLEESHE